MGAGYRVGSGDSAVSHRARIPCSNDLANFLCLIYKRFPARCQSASDGSSAVAMVANECPLFGTVRNTGKSKPTSRNAIPTSLAICVERVSYDVALCIE